MNQKAIVLSVLIFFVVVGGMFAFAYFKKKELERTATPVPAKEIVDVVKTPVRINGMHFFVDGTHTVIGDVVLGSTCDLITVDDTLVAESAPEQVRILLSVVNNDTEQSSCIQTPTTRRFKTIFTASKNAIIQATLNGEPALLNLIEGDPKQNPDDVGEIFLKG